MNEPTNQSYQTAVVDTATLKKLAALHDKNDGAISIYFSQKFGTTGNSQHLLADRFLKEAAELASKLSLPSASFASFRQAVLDRPGNFHYFLRVGTETLAGTLPVSRDVSQIERGYRLDLFPLLDALESCKPFLVLLFESDRARLFMGRGDAMNELHDALPSRDLEVRADDSRVGWSHHIEGNVDHRSEAYWRELAFQTTGWLNRLQAEDLVIGCRKDLWGHASHQFSALQRKFDVALFPLLSFEASQHDVMLAAKQARQELRADRYSTFEAEKSDVHSVTGLEGVLNALESGAASALMLAHDTGERIMECDGCGKGQSANRKTCVFCGGTGLHGVLPEALLATRAILSDAKVLTMQETARPVRALLRY